MRKSDPFSLLYLVSLILLGVMLQGCQKRGFSIAPTPTLVTATPISTSVRSTPQITPNASPTPKPSPTPTPIPEVWHFVAFGDESIIAEGELSFATHYASYIAEDLGVNVEVELYTVADILVKDQLDRLRNDPELRNAISNAQVVTLATGDIDIIYPVINSYVWESCGGEDNEDCIREALDDFRTYYDALLEEVLELCTSGTIIRTMTLYTRSLQEIYGSDEDLKPFYILLNDQIIKSSRTHSIPVVIVHDIFGNAKESITYGYLNPAGWNPTESGSKVIANLHRELGYEATCP